MLITQLMFVHQKYCVCSLTKKASTLTSVFFFSPSSDSVVSVLFLEVNRSVDATVIPVLSTSCGTKRDKSMSWTPVVSI